MNKKTSSKGSAETILRIFTMWKKIPSKPSTISDKKLHEYLQDENFKCDIKTVRRDLVKLSSILNLEEKEKNWCVINKSNETLSPSEALGLLQAQQYLKSTMPQKSLDILSSKFEQAKATLTNNEKFNNWQDRINVVGTSIPLITTQVNDNIRNSLYDCVLEAKQLGIEYKKNSGVISTYHLNAYGLILKEHEQYLVASKHETSAKLQLFKFSQVIEVKADALKYGDNTTIDNNLIKDYVNSQVSNFLITPELIELEIKIAGTALAFFEHNKLHVDQQISYVNKNDKKYGVLTSPVDLTHNLVHFILGHGKFIEVVNPPELIKAIQERQEGDYF